MAARASWKGYLKLSLVSCAVQLYPASTSKERVSFHMLNRETGHRLKRQMVDAETGEPVESENTLKGYEISKRQYIHLEDEEIESVALESTHTIDIDTFVPRDEIDETYLDTPYYLAPDGKVAEEAFAVIRDAMREKGVVGLGRVVLSRRERIVMLEPRDKGLVAMTLRYAYEVRSGEDVFEMIGDVKVDDDTLDLATHIVERKGDLRPAWLRIIGHEVAAAREGGVPVEGICVYPITDYPGWDDERHCPTGLLGYPDSDGTRPVYGPLAAELARQQRR